MTPWSARVPGHAGAASTLKGFADSRDRGGDRAANSDGAFARQLDDVSNASLATRDAKVEGSQDQTVAKLKAAATIPGEGIAAQSLGDAAPDNELWPAKTEARTSQLGGTTKDASCEICLAPARETVAAGWDEANRAWSGAKATTHAGGAGAGLRAGGGAPVLTPATPTALPDVPDAPDKIEKLAPQTSVTAPVDGTAGAPSQSAVVNHGTVADAAPNVKNIEVLSGRSASPPDAVSGASPVDAGSELLARHADATGTPAHRQSVHDRITNRPPDEFATLAKEEKMTAEQVAPPQAPAAPVPQAPDVAIAVAVSGAPAAVKPIAQVLRPVGEVQRTVVARDAGRSTDAGGTMARGASRDAAIPVDNDAAAAPVLSERSPPNLKMPSELIRSAKGSSGKEDVVTVDVTILRNETHMAPAATPSQAVPSVGLQVSARVAEALTGWTLPQTNAGAAPALSASAAGATKVLTIALAPADLGMVTVHMTMRGGELEVRVEAHEAAAARALSDDKSSLLGGLKAAGYDIGAISVTVSDQAVRFAPPAASSGDGPANQNQQQAQSQGGSGGAGSNAGGSDGQASQGRRQPGQQQMTEGAGQAPATGSRHGGVYL